MKVSLNELREFNKKTTVMNRIRKGSADIRYFPEEEDVAIEIYSNDGSNIDGVAIYPIDGCQTWNRKNLEALYIDLSQGKNLPPEAIIQDDKMTVDIKNISIEGIETSELLFKNTKFLSFNDEKSVEEAIENFRQKEMNRKNKGNFDSENPNRIFNETINKTNTEIEHDISLKINNKN